ncbi:hypothetical protein Moror_6156 [Moniliophthora roreri MCA 2997]|uniref:Uncharacterized protein n=1 Tax=Moniliophthora roreri (strain MCA 2997) TaxID=1381753 RepID=V2WWC0_MONRO|nr:hypothetical protein Moror_6156 [Moniliophthora roreri MCA 2997]
MHLGTKHQDIKRRFRTRLSDGLSPTPCSVIHTSAYETIVSYGSDDYHCLGMTGSRKSMIWCTSYANVTDEVSDIRFRSRWGDTVFARSRAKPEETQSSGTVVVIGGEEKFEIHEIGHRPVVHTV